MEMTTGFIPCPYCDNVSYSGNITFVKQNLKNHIRELHTLEEIRGYQDKTGPVSGKEESSVQEGMMKALPVIVELLSNKKFVEFVEQQGYRFDVSEIFRMFAAASGWKFTTNPIQPIKDKN